MFMSGRCPKVRMHQVKVLPKPVKLQRCHNEHGHVHITLYCHSVDVLIRLIELNNTTYDIYRDEDCQPDFIEGDNVIVKYAGKSRILYFAC